MNDPSVIAAAIVTVIVAFSGAAISIINARAAAAERRDARASRARLEEYAKTTDNKASTIIEKAVEIHTLTNSNLSKVTAALDSALAKIEGLEKLVKSQSEAKSVADNLARHKKENSNDSR